MSQIPAKIEKLKQELQKEFSSDSTKVDILNKLSWEFHRVNVQQSFDYAQEALDIAQKIEYKKGVSRALNLLSIAYSFQGEEQKAFDNNILALELAKEINDSFLISVCNNDLGIIYDDNKKNPKKALECYHEALRYSGQDDVLKFFTLMNLSILYNAQENEQEAENYLLKAIREAESNTDSSAQISFNEFWGYYHQEKEQLDTALSYFNKALKLADLTGDLYSVASINSSLGDIYSKQNFYERSKTSHLKAVNLFEEMGNNLMLHFSLLSLAETYNKSKEYKKAVETAHRGAKLAESVGSNNSMIYYCEVLAEGYGGVGEYKKAFEYQKLYTQKKDTIFQIQQQKAIAEIETKYEVEQQEKENEILRAKEEKNEAKLRFQTLWLWGSSIMAVLGIAFVVVLFRLFRQKRRYNRQLEEQVEEKTASLSKAVADLKSANGELERFTFIASHDLKEPIRNIVSFSNLLKQEVADNENSKEYIGFITKSAKHLYSLISDVLEFSRINKEEVPTELVDVNQVLHDIEEGIKVSQNGNYPIEFQYGAMPQVNTSGSHFYLVMKNLIENGIKYNQNSPAKISITHNLNGSKHYFSVKDNGIGIPEKFQEKVFEMFSRLHNRHEYEGTGMGLAICKKIITRLKGDIVLESKEGEGSTFTFTIPKSPS